MVTDVARADRAEQGVGERVQDDVGVAVADQAAIVGDHRMPPDAESPGPKA